MSGTNPLDGLRPGPAPRELRARVLAAAAEARATAATRAHWIDRAWESRALRLAWGVALLAVLLGHLAVGGAAEIAAERFRIEPAPRPVPSWEAASEARAELP